MHRGRHIVDLTRKYMRTSRKLRGIIQLVMLMYKDILLALHALIEIRMFIISYEYFDYALMFVIR